MDINYYSNRLQIKTSQIKGAGMGVFTVVDIPANTPICCYKGQLYNKNNMNNKSRYRMYVNHEYILDGQSVFSEGKYINDAYKSPFTNNVKVGRFHKCGPQGVEPYFIVKSKRDIKAGEELFMSYGSGYWSTFKTI